MTWHCKDPGIDQLGFHCSCHDGWLLVVVVFFACFNGSPLSKLSADLDCGSDDGEEREIGRL